MKSTLFCIVGMSGSGKTTIMRRLMDNEVVSVITRDKRPGEKHGVDYYFINDLQYKTLEDGDFLIEKNIYDGKKYGITKDELNFKLQKDAFAIVDICGMRQLKKYYQKTVSIFIYSDINEVKNRMILRGQNEESLQNRLSTYRKEYMSGKYECDYAIKNVENKLYATVDIVRKILIAEGTNLKLKRRLLW